MEIRKQLVTSRAKTWGGGSACSSITIHETANTSRGAGAAAHANLQSRGNVRDASWHYQVDDTEVVQSFPDDVKCWHAGSTSGAANSIAIEICVNADSDYDKALANAAALVAHLRAEHDLGRGDVVQHNHWTGKNCPTKLRAAGTWRDFVASTDPQEDDVAIKLDDEDIDRIAEAVSKKKNTLSPGAAEIAGTPTLSVAGALQQGVYTRRDVRDVRARLAAIEKAVNRGTPVSARDVAAELRPLLAADIRAAITAGIATLPSRDAEAIADHLAANLAARLTGTQED